MSVFVDTEKGPPLSYGYPRLRITRSSKLIVLFTGQTTGTVIDPGRSAHDVGHWSDNWVDDLFEDFTGKVTLKND